MTIVCRVTIQGILHRIRIALPEGQDPQAVPGLREFAVATACLEHSGYLPRGIINALDGPVRAHDGQKK